MKKREEHGQHGKLHDGEGLSILMLHPDPYETPDMFKPSCKGGGAQRSQGSRVGNPRGTNFSITRGSLDMSLRTCVQTVQLWLCQINTYSPCGLSAHKHTDTNPGTWNAFGKPVRKRVPVQGTEAIRSDLDEEAGVARLQAKLPNMHMVKGITSGMHASLA